MIGTVVKVGAVALCAAAIHGAFSPPWGKGTTTMTMREFLQPVRERPAVLHDIPWYTSHDAARRATLDWCRTSADRQAMTDCRNAQAADAGASRGTSRDPLSFLDDPGFWRGSPMAQGAAQEACRHPERPGWQAIQGACRASRAAGNEAR